MKACWRLLVCLTPIPHLSPQRRLLLRLPLGRQKKEHRYQQSLDAVRRIASTIASRMYLIWRSPSHYVNVSIPCRAAAEPGNVHVLIHDNGGRLVRHVVRWRDSKLLRAGIANSNCIRSKHHRHRHGRQLLIANNIQTWVFGFGGETSCPRAVEPSSLLSPCIGTEESSAVPPFP